MPITRRHKLAVSPKTTPQLCAGTSKTENVSEHRTVGLTIDQHLT